MPKLLLVFYILCFYVMVLVYYFDLSTDPDPEYVKLNEFVQNYNVERIFDLEFQYVIKNRCDRGLRIILMVTSYAGQTAARTAQRAAYPRDELYALGIYRVFLLGMLRAGEGNVSQEDIILENAVHNDIVQGNFLEAYKNLTYKNTMGLAWTVTECEFDYLIKQDDDISIDIYQLLELLEITNQSSYDLLGNLYTGKFQVPSRDPSYKWYVTKEEYSQEIYPPYLLGWMFVLREVAAKKLLFAAQNTSFLWVDDVLLTGILADKARLVHEDMERHWRDHLYQVEECLADTAKCDFIVGPSEGRFEIIVEVQKKIKAYSEFKKHVRRYLKEYGLQYFLN